MTSLLITAGPSREYFDDVRFLSNASSGTMGIEVARAARAAGWDVHLALGPVATPPPGGVEVHPFVSAVDLHEIAGRLWPEMNALVATAAVCDYRPRERIPGKRKKSPDDWQPALTRTPDVLASLAARKGDRRVVGFALETTLDREEARRKLVQKGLDLIILNTAANLGSGRGDFDWLEAGSLFLGEASFREISKRELADQIVEFLRRSLETRLPRRE